MSWVELKISTKVIAADTPNQVAYEATATVAACNGIPAELFVFDTSSQVYSHVASVRDLTELPGTYGDAEANGSSFYRQNSATQRFDRTAGVVEFVSYVKNAVRTTNAAWGKTQPEVVGLDEYVVYDSETT